MNDKIEASIYKDLPLELFTPTDLTDALSVEVAAGLLNTSKRSIYTIRHSNYMSPERTQILRTAIRADEESCRSRLVALRHMKEFRQNEKATRADKKNRTK